MDIKEYFKMLEENKLIEQELNDRKAKLLAFENKKLEEAIANGVLKTTEYEVKTSTKFNQKIAIEAPELNSFLKTTTTIKKTIDVKELKKVDKNTYDKFCEKTTKIVFKKQD